MGTVKDKFVNYLKNNHLKVTKERIDIFENLMSQESHLNADDLFLRLKAKGIKVSRATVYNTLQLLTKSNIITRSNLGESHQHYETCYGMPQHYHLVCNQCGSIIEFENKEIETIQNHTCQKYKFTPLDFNFQIIGICEKCSKMK